MKFYPTSNLVVEVDDQKRLIIELTGRGRSSLKQSKAFNSRYSWRRDTSYYNEDRLLMKAFGTGWTIVDDLNGVPGKYFVPVPLSIYRKEGAKEYWYWGEVASIIDPLIAGIRIALPYGASAP